MSNSQYFPPYLTSGKLDSSEITVDLNNRLCNKNRLRQYNTC